MRYGGIIVGIIAAVVPALGQQSDSSSGNQGVVDQRVFQDALRKAMRRSLELSANSPLKRPLVNFDPSRRIPVVNLPPTTCAIPLLSVPTKDGDNGIFLKNGTPSADNKILRPGIPVCGENRGQ